MKDSERQNKTLTLGEVLNTTVLKDKFNRTAFSKVAKHSAIFSFWKNIAGNKLAAISKPYKIRGSKIYVTAKSPTVCQQINLTKNIILEKLNVFSKPLNINITEIVTGYKNYDEITAPVEIPEEEKIIRYGENELNEVKIDDDTIKSVKNSIAKINILTDEQKEKLVNKIINNYKAEIYRKNIKNG